MGILRRLSGAENIPRVQQRVVSECAGHPPGSQFTIVVTQADIGVSNKLPTATNILVSQIQALGHSVTGVEIPPWAGTAYISVVAGASFTSRPPDALVSPTAAVPADVPPTAPSRSMPSNLLPRDNVYLTELFEANREFTGAGWQIRVTACRMWEPEQLEVALVVPGEDPVSFRASLDALPGPAAVMAVVEHRMTHFGKRIAPLYYSESMWRNATHEWSYNGE